MPASDPFIARGRCENYDIEVATASTIVPSTNIPPASRTISYSHPFYIKGITIYYHTESLLRVKTFTWAPINPNNLSSTPKSQAMLTMQETIESTYQH
ncbi:ed3a3fcd-d3a2-41fc-8c3e-afd8b95f28b3 [Sclerotinia trifoliorum]|uniref:Ed3a3fcd-d3a2-41fc-8c3e-afd8b95f28b3 n=1 Tax=Sclerotinia trifoliorum TaxID=28548 RepID=A0A8H2VZC3_9HELO|nr:ed3a3fcd-d3a2-41fc-8c3e-afd8b95f28b3 [Sclerotinia trifoliorum]